MIGMTSHLHEERLFDCYLTARSGEPLDPRAVEHLADCRDCAARYDDLTQFMNRLSEDADAEIDAVFSPEQLQHQQKQINRRLELVGRSARVLTFPHHVSPRQLPATGRRSFPRWVAATAAAGLFAGVGAGVFLQRDSQMPPSAGAQSRAVSAPADGQRPATVPAAVADADGRDRFLSELELAADRPGTAELAAYDELTPHIREISFALPGR